MASVIDTYGMPPTALLREHDGACRYLTRVTGGKCLDAAQVKTIHGMGRVIVQNFEDSSDNAKGGATQGHADAQFSLDLIRSLGSPQGTAVYFSVDFEIHSGFGTVDDYFRAVRQVLHPAGYKVGAYGCFDLIKHLFDAGLIDYGWQCAAWSYGHVEPRAHLYQNEYNDSYDVNQIQHADFGAWTPTGAQSNARPDLLEEIAMLEGAPKDLTYAQLLKDVADASATATAPAVWHHELQHGKEKIHAGSLQVATHTLARSAALALTAKTVGVVARVAALTKKQGA